MSKHVEKNHFTPKAVRGSEKGASLLDGSGAVKGIQEVSIRSRSVSMSWNFLGREPQDSWFMRCCPVQLKQHLELNVKPSTKHAQVKESMVACE